MAKKPTKRAPTDSTLRNVRAATKRLAQLEKRVQALEDQNARSGDNVTTEDGSESGSELPTGRE